MHSERTLVELVGLAYEAAGDPAQWTTFLERLGQVLQTPWCVFHVHDLAHGRCDVTAEIGFEPAFRRSYEEHYVSRNAFFIHGKRQLVAGNVCQDPQLCPDNLLFRSEFYNDWLRPQGMLHGLNATVLSNQSLVSLLGLIRERHAAPPDAHDVALVQALMSHLQRAVQLHHRFADLQALGQAATEALDRWPMGVIVLDTRGGVLLMNRSAEDLVNRRDGLCVAAGRLRALRADETARIWALVHNALTARNDPLTRPGGFMAVSRPGSKRPLHLEVAPLPDHRALPASRRAGCIVFVSDPDRAADTDERFLERLYGLTPAESRVARRLIEGKDIRRVSEELHVSLNTTRTHVKRVLNKTNTKRQSELVSLILRSRLPSRPK